MELTRGGRGVSTVVDVTLCLTLVSAAVLTLAVVTDSGTDHDPDRAERAAELLGATTTDVEYSIAPGTADDEFDDGRIDTRHAYERTDHGPVAGLLASAAVADTDVDGSELTRAGEGYSVALDGVISDTAVETDGGIHVTAVWEPYRESSLRGEVTAGPEPPVDGAVSSATMTVASGLDGPNEAELRTAYEHDYDTLVGTVAESVVDGLFPPEETQLALERQGVERQLVEYRYRRAVRALDGVEDYDVDEEIRRTSADARAANDVLADAVATEIVAGELSAALDEEIGDSPTPRTDAERVAEATDELLSVGEVRLVVRTWDT